MWKGHGGHISEYSNSNLVEFKHHIIGCTEPMKGVEELQLTDRINSGIWKYCVT